MTPEQEQQVIVAAQNATDIVSALNYTGETEPEFRVTIQPGADGDCIRLAQLVGDNKWLTHVIPDSGDFTTADIRAAIAMTRDLRDKASTPTALKE